MNEFKQKHKHHIRLWFLLIIIIAVSGYYAFRTPQDKIQNTDNKIQVITDQTQKANEKAKDTTTTLVTSYELQVTSTNKIATTTENIIQDDEITNPATLIVNGEEYYTAVPESTTVYEMMQNLTLMSSKPFVFKTKEYSGMGHFVESINGVKNDPQAGKYWIYYINGESAKSGISFYELNSNDVTEWKYESSTF